MPEWFIMVVISGQLTLVGPFTEGDCRLTKELLFAGKPAYCIEERVIRGKQRSA